jgi:ribosome biogenesis GTPase
VGRRTQTIAANIDQAIIVTSAAQPDPKPHLVDRYIVSAHAGEMAPVICMNKIDLDVDGSAAAILDRYDRLGYRTLRTSVITREGIDELRNELKNRSTVIAGQSGVGKSSLLNTIQPGLLIRVGEVSAQSEKGRHTTTTACLHRLDFGGYVVDTPGIRSFDLSIIPAGELEAYFIEFVPLVLQCKFPDCTHTHETECAVKAGVERGDVHPHRYETYLALFDEASQRPDYER